MIFGGDKLIPKQRVLFTAGRSILLLDLARQFYRAGFEVFVADTSRYHLSRFSRVVKRTFVVPSPRKDTEGFIRELVKVCGDAKIDLVVPTFEEGLYIARYRDRFPDSCEVFCDSFDKMHSLHNKWLFHNKLEELGLTSPKTFVIKSKEELESLPLSGTRVLKACYSRSGQTVYRLLEGQELPQVEISQDNPWIVQEWIDGPYYYTYSVCHKGKVSAHATYKLDIKMDRLSWTTFSLSFESVKDERVLDWVERFAKATELTGQFGFDFVEDARKQLYCIECNPRSTSGLYLFSKGDGLPFAFMDPKAELIQPKEKRRRQILIAMAIWGWRQAYQGGKLGSFFKAFFTSSDVIFDWKDPLPLFVQPLLAFSYWRNARRLKKNMAHAFYDDLEWNLVSDEEDSCAERLQETVNI